MNAALLQLYARQWTSTWRQRAREFVFWRKHVHVWREGYTYRSPPTLALVFEAAVRLAELLGAGLVAQALEALFAGRRYRSLSQQEVEKVGAQLRQARLSPVALTRVRYDTGASLTAGRLNVAYVFGYVVKAARPLTLPVLVHECVHVVQFERWGWAYVAKCLWALARGGGYAYAAEAPLTSLSAEQEAARVEDGVRLRLGLATRYVYPAPKSPAHDPLLRERQRSGGRVA